MHGLAATSKTMLNVVLKLLFQKVVNYPEESLFVLLKHYIYKLPRNIININYYDELIIISNNSSIKSNALIKCNYNIIGIILLLSTKNSVFFAKVCRIFNTKFKLSILSNHVLNFLKLINIKIFRNYNICYISLYEYILYSVSKGKSIYLNYPTINICYLADKKDYFHSIELYKLIIYLSVFRRSFIHHLLLININIDCINIQKNKHIEIYDKYLAVRNIVSNITFNNNLPMIIDNMTIDNILAFIDILDMGNPIPALENIINIDIISINRAILYKLLIHKMTDKNQAYELMHKNIIDKICDPFFKFIHLNAILLLNIDNEEYKKLFFNMLIDIQFSYESSEMLQIHKLRFLLNITLSDIIIQEYVKTEICIKKFKNCNIFHQFYGAINILPADFSHTIGNKSLADDFCKLISHVSKESFCTTIHQYVQNVWNCIQLSTSSIRYKYIQSVFIWACASNLLSSNHFHFEEIFIVKTDNSQRSLFNMLYEVLTIIKNKSYIDNLAEFLRRYCIPIFTPNNSQLKLIKKLILYETEVDIVQNKIQILKLFVKDIPKFMGKKDILRLKDINVTI